MTHRGPRGHRGDTNLASGLYTQSLSLNFPGLRSCLAQHRGWPSSWKKPDGRCSWPTSQRASALAAQPCPRGVTAAAGDRQGTTDVVISILLNVHLSRM